MDVNEFIDTYPTLYHMAEVDSWPNIQNHGLLSTSALLDLYKINGTERVGIESLHRPECIKIQRKGFPDAVVRDQKPMSDKALKKVLLDDLKPRDWYEILNQKVFFWSTKDKVINLLKARAYRDKAHDVLSVDTAKLVERYKESIVLCPYNSGSTIMKPVERGKDLFKPIDEYDFPFWKKKRGRSKAVTEVCVTGGVPLINEVVIDVHQMQNDKVLKKLHP